jgi:hypothetical protein
MSAAENPRPIRTVDVAEWAAYERPDMALPYVVTASPYGETITRAYATEDEARAQVAYVASLTGTYGTSWGDEPVNTHATIVHYVDATPATPAPRPLDRAQIAAALASVMSDLEAGLPAALNAIAAEEAAEEAARDAARAVTPDAETYYSNPYADGPHDAARVARYAPNGTPYSPAAVEAAASAALGRPAVALQRIDAWVYCRAAAPANA